jgi:amino acid adenylation domain-containing protein
VEPGPALGGADDSRPSREPKTGLLQPIRTGTEIATPFSVEATIHSLFFEQAERTPDAIAIIDEQDELTYRQLCAYVRSLARRLSDFGAGPNRRIGIYLERSVDMVTALLAVLATGAAYVPLDPGYPADRLGFMVNDADVMLVITQRSLRNTLPVIAAPVVLIDDLDLSALDAAPSGPVSPDDLAYVIYTSGSTGRPKGVEIRHRSVVNLLLSMQRLLDVTAADTVLTVANISFDMSVPELFLALIVGALMVVVSRAEAADGRRLLARWQQSGATVMQATPVIWRLLIGAGWAGAPGLKLVCGGEAVDADLARQLLARAGRFWNFYGPTEATVWSTAHEVTRIEGPRVPIGRPLANTRLYILDPQQRRVPMGDVGELYIGGVGVARGYLGRPDLTAERFLDDPFADDGAARMYRTGDLASFRPDGSVEFRGRVDHQIKVRGLRIELEEIEAVLAEFPGVREAAVVARPGLSVDLQLIAFVIGTEDVVDRAALRQSLRARLPSYMLPARIIEVDNLPLTLNGKIDRQRLPSMIPQKIERAVPYEPAGDPIEARLVKVFETLLTFRPIGIHDEFFEFGGDSLLALNLLEFVREGFGRVIEVNALYEHGSTVAALARMLRDLPSPDGLDRETIKNSEDVAAFGELVAMRHPVEQAEAYYGNEYLLIRNNKTEEAVARTRKALGGRVREVSDFTGFLAALSGRIHGKNVIVALGDSTTANFNNWPYQLTANPGFRTSDTVILNIADWAVRAGFHIEHLEVTLDWLRRRGASNLAVVFLGGFTEGHKLHESRQEFLSGRQSAPFRSLDYHFNTHRFGGELRRLQHELPSDGGTGLQWYLELTLATLGVMEQICADADSAFVAVMQPLSYADLAPGYHRELRRLYQDEAFRGTYEEWRRERRYTPDAFFRSPEEEIRPVHDALAAAWRQAGSRQRHGAYVDCSALFRDETDQCFDPDGLHYDSTGTSFIVEAILEHLPKLFRSMRYPVDQAEAYYGSEYLLIHNNKTDKAVAMTRTALGERVREVSDFSGFQAALSDRIHSKNVIVALGDSTTANFNNWPYQLAANPGFCRSDAVILNLADWAARAGFHIEHLEVTLDWLRRRGASKLAVVFLGGFAEGCKLHQSRREFLSGKRSAPFRALDYQFNTHRFGGELRRLQHKLPSDGGTGLRWYLELTLATIEVLEQVCADADSAFVAVMQPLSYADLAPGYHRELRRLHQDEAFQGTYEQWRRERRYQPDAFFVIPEKEIRPVHNALAKAWRGAGSRQRHGAYVDCSALFQGETAQCFERDGLHYDSTGTSLIVAAILEHLPKPFRNGRFGQS